MAITPFIGVAVALWRQHGPARAGPDGAVGASSPATSAGCCIGTISISLIVQGGTIAVGPSWPASDQQGAAGQFLNGLQTARIPLFLFQAILASLLPKLSR